LNLTIIILAAGQATPVGSDLPRVLHPLAGRPMVCFVLDAARALQPSSLFVVVGHGAKEVRQALGDGVVCLTEVEQLGTGHAVRQAEEAAAGRSETVLVLYGDTPLIRPETLRHMVDCHQSEGAALTLLTFRPDGPPGYGRVVRDGDTGRVLAVVEERELTPEQQTIDEANSGILCFRDEWLWPNLGRVRPKEVPSLRQQSQSPPGQVCLTDLAAVACEQGERVVALPAPDALEVLSVDNRLKLAQAEAEMRRRINRAWMLAGVTLIHPETTYIDANVEIGSDTVIWPNTFVQGPTRIGRACTIGPGTVIRASTIGDGCRVELSVAEEAIMEAGSEVGPFGHLRKGAHLGAGVHMGNFGEVKNSHLGPGVKMGHFSYVGDATVGADANIGAGTITCNYDGQRKHRTIIGERAFIGSDTMLVAPVEVGAGAKTGAGSVVTRDVPPGNVAYGVPARVRSGSGTEGSEVE
jgi:bifunctional UDP-N-acetylglucosamine pyrophosphorylase/glucosamine-1-phosphate N-acetyltransferase